MFIQVMQGRALDPPGIRRELNRWHRQLATDADGWLGATAGVTEDGWSIVVMHFDSEQQAHRNSDRPEHRAWWREAAQHLGEVAFHDAPTVCLFGDGRSDLAGYVQVIQGHIDDLERMASLGGDQEEVLAREAPHILGVTVAEHADRPGDFTQILYFTSEQDARRFEVEPLTDADESAQEERRGLMTDLRSFDLREPQLLVPPVVVTYYPHEPLPSAGGQREQADGQEVGGDPVHGRPGRVDQPACSPHDRRTCRSEAPPPARNVRYDM